MQKKYLLIVMLALVLSIVVAGCANNGSNDVDPTATPGSQTYDDDDYEIEIQGVGENVIKITKKQIRDLAKSGKEVVFTEEQPAYASDKTDDNGNKIPHTLKGVYLDDLLAEYANGAKVTDYSDMSIYSTDGYETILTADVFNVDKGGVKMIIAYEYDGVVLNPEEKSGALRVVFPDKPANSWAKMINKIVLAKSEDTVTIPQTSSIYVVEALDEKYDGSYELDDITYYGISFEKLFQDNILTASESDQMLVYAWDGEEYTSLKSYEYYIDAFLVYATKDAESQDIVPDKNAPVFNGVNILKGMKVKGTMYATVGNSTIVSLKMAFGKLDADKKGEVTLAALLNELNMKNSSTYTVKGVDGTSVDVASGDLSSAKVISKDTGYFVKIADKEFVLSSIKVK